MRNYKILESKVRRLSEDAEIMRAIEEAGAKRQREATPAFSAQERAALLAEDFSELLGSEKGIGHERADQVVLELIYGVR
jgi:hypothetical protein